MKLSSYKVPNKKILKLFNETISYDEKRGRLKWKKNISPKIKKGKIAGNISSDLYVVVGFNGTTYKAHRIAWFLYYGEWPKGMIDHINGIKYDNRIKNLRESDKYHNQHNQIKHRKGLPIGVSFRKKFNNWQATAPANFLKRKSNKQKYIGVFKTEKEAELAVIEFCMKG